MSTYANKRGAGLWVVVALGLVLSAPAAVLYQETFTGSNPGWIDRDTGVDWDIAYSSGLGNLPGSVEGQFYEQDEPAPQTDAWRRDAGDLMGSYNGFQARFTTPGTPTAWRFSIYALDILPSDLSIRFGNGVNTFQQVINTGSMSVGSWFTVTVPLTYAGWFGGTAGDFASALSGVTFIDVQVTRNGAGEQFYYMDNFQVIDDVQAVAGAIPEPATGLFWFGAMLLYGLRRHVRQAEDATA